MLEILRWVLIAYIVCGALHGFVVLLRDDSSGLGLPRFIARFFLNAAFGFFPLIVVIYALISVMAAAFALEWRELRRELRDPQLKEDGSTLLEYSQKFVSGFQDAINGRKR